MNRHEHGRAPAIDRSLLLAIAASLAMALVLALLLANEEIQIEGSSGWAASLPTWRIDGGWMLDVFWGGRTMTGYHVYIFSFVALFFHFPFAFYLQWSWRAEIRALGSIALFWVVEDFLWFVLNPAYGLSRFGPSFIPWHHHWLFGLPTDYWIGLSTAAICVGVAAREGAASKLH